jgi:hypothetical protein
MDTKKKKGLELLREQRKESNERNWLRSTLSSTQQSIIDAGKDSKKKK